MNYLATIGLEVHVQLDTKTKMFCPCRNEYGAPPNSLTCPVCMGLPGALPVINEEAVKLGLKTALALGCKVAEISSFERKNYFYPDLPKNYQITQFSTPLAADGAIEIVCDGKPATAGRQLTVRIRRVHLEEDAGKLSHAEGENRSFIDLNRSGVPLIEIVSEADMSSPEQAYEYLTVLKRIIQYLGVSRCDMEKGELRCDANLSVRPEGRRELGTKTEIKNLNSFRHVQRGLAHEIERQTKVLREGGTIRQETRLFDAERERTELMRVKEGSDDYRYFPEPDLGPLRLKDEWLAEARASQPELPAARAERFVREYALTPYAAGVLTSGKEVADYFEECVTLGKDPKAAANWVMGPMLEVSKQRTDSPFLWMPPSKLVGLICLVKDNTITASAAKAEVFPEMVKTGKSANEIVGDKQLTQVSDEAAIEEAIRQVIGANPKPVADYKKGKKTAITYLVGQVMRQTRGKANPRVVTPLLERALDDLP